MKKKFEFFIPWNNSPGMKKIMTFMKLTLLILFLTVFQAWADVSYSQTATVSVNLKDATVERVLQQIEDQSEFFFLYSKSVINVDRKVSIQLKDVKINEVLKALFDETNVSYSVEGRQIVLSQKVSSSEQNFQQQKGISGKVTDSSGNPLPGVSVLIKGTNKGTVTDSDGNYDLSGFPEAAVLQFSFIGLKSQEVKISGRSIVNIALAEETVGIDEVVAVGYGVQKKTSLTNSISQISSKEISRRPVSNIQQSLQGQLPGVSVFDLGGSPGRSAATIRVRGVTTFNTNKSTTSGYDLSKNNALVIVDGIEQSWSNINSDDIESISILKDASSTAIYGSRATNGVILVTTKSASKGKVQVDVNSYYALQQSINKPEMMDLKSYMVEQQAAYTNAGVAVPAKFTDAGITEYVNATDREAYPLPNRWFQTLLRTAPQFNQTVSISGGNDVVQSRLSYRYFNQDGIIKNYGSQLNDVRFNSIYTISPTIKATGTINYRSNYSYVPTVDPINYFLHGSLWATPKYSDGTYGLSTQGNNPLMYIEKGGLSKSWNDYLSGSAKVEWELVKGLEVSSMFGFRSETTQQKNYTNAYINTDKVKGITKTVSNNSLTEVRNTLKEYTWNNLITYTTNWGNHSLKALAGYSQIGNKQTYLSAYRERFYNNDIQSIGQGANDATKSNDGYDAEYGLISYFSRINYGFSNKYLFEVNGRYDGSSKFTGSKQYGFFPSFSAGWVVSNESFWKSLEAVVNNFKLRGSWGVTGNQSVDLYSYYASLSSKGYNFNGTSVLGYRQTAQANSELGWESTKQLDLGFDASLFNSKLSVTFDYYRKITDDILLNLDIPATIGLTASAQNAGSVKNEGIEVSFDYRNSINNKLDYRVGGNFSINNNEVLDLKGTGPYITGTDINPRYIIKEGLPINTLWGYKTDGLFQLQSEIDEYKATYTSNTKPGDVKYVDLKKDGKIDSNDMVALGNSSPKYTFGFNADFSYKNFELNLLFQGVADVDVRIAGALAEMGNQEGFTSKIYTNNYWTPENTNARFPRPVKYDLRNVATSDRLIIDGSYLRLKNVELAYNIPVSKLNLKFIKSIRIYSSATNLFTISKLNEWNLDPEVESGRAVYYPQTALYTFGAKLQF